MCSSCGRTHIHTGIRMHAQYVTTLSAYVYFASVITSGRFCNKALMMSRTTDSMKVT